MLKNVLYRILTTANVTVENSRVRVTYCARIKCRHFSDSRLDSYVTRRSIKIKPIAIVNSRHARLDPRLGPSNGGGFSPRSSPAASSGLKKSGGIQGYMATAKARLQWGGVWVLCLERCPAPARLLV